MNTVITDKKAAAEYVAEIDRKAEELKNIIIMAHDTVRPVGTKYYVSENGDDANDGISPETPIKTFDGVSKLPLVSGDAVLFKRGETFRGKMLAKEGVTYSAYGEGAKPIIMLSPENGAGEEKWTLVEGTTDIYKYHIEMNDLGGVVCMDKDGKVGNFMEKVCLYNDAQRLQYFFYCLMEFGLSRVFLNNLRNHLINI